MRFRGRPTADFVSAMEMTWDTIIRAEETKPYFRDLQTFLAEQRESGAKVFPPDELTYRALQITPFSAVTVVILGQDPYHGQGQAHGLAFSVPQGVVVPPSLRNIFKELAADIGIGSPRHGCLESWARQGVLLLNTVLTVEDGTPQSHRGRGWEQFTDTLITALSTHRHGLVFLLWGSQAQAKQSLIDRSKHTVLCAAHPSPLSAYRGFLGCKHFSETNSILSASGSEPIDWSITEL